MIRIDEIYDNIFSPNILNKPKQSIHYFDPFGRTDPNALQVSPLIIERDKAFLCWDQEPYFPEVHEYTIDWFQNTFILGNNPKTKVIFITSEKNSKNVNELCSKYNFEQNYYFFHGWAALDWYRGYDRTFLIPDFKDRNISNTFICPNRVVSGKREHRVELFTEMVNNNLLNNNKVSFPKVCPYNKEEFNIDGVDLPLVFKGEDANNIPNESYKVSLWNHAKNSLLYVVTETVFKEQTLHLTEKTFKPIVMQMPFILVAPQYSLEYLRSYGFKTFNEFWNEDYDNCNNTDRIKHIANLITDLNNLSTQEIKQLQRHLAPIVEYNYNWFYSNDFENLLWNELKGMINKW